MSCDAVVLGVGGPLLNYKHQLVSSESPLPAPTHFPSSHHEFHYPQFSGFMFLAVSQPIAQPYDHLFTIE